LQKQKLALKPYTLWVLDKRRLAQTREGLREAGADALRMAAAHETPTETPTIFGPGNAFDDGDDDEIEELRTKR
jgi:hypothetical protein